MPAAAQLLIFVAIIVVFWMLLIRPQRNQQRQMRELQRQVEVGDEVVISAGIFGTVRSVDETKVELEIAPDTVITVARQVVVRRADDVVGADDAVTGDDGEDGETDTDATAEPVDTDEKSE